MMNEYRIKAMPKGGFVISEPSGAGIVGFTTIDEALNYIKANISLGC